jgi:hypothetical protein
VKKALTDEEWASGPKESVSHLYNVVYWRHDGRLTVDGEFDGEELHALAALCLYGQPFGLTHADVDLLLRVRDNLDGDNWRDMPDGLKNLADRIEALLPPRAP